MGVLDCIPFMRIIPQESGTVIGLLTVDGFLHDSIRILCTEIDVFDQLRGLQTPEALFGDHQHFPDHRYRPIDPLVALGGIGPKPEGREG